MRSDHQRRVIEQFKARLPAVPIEVMWAIGNVVPADFKPPPDWAKKAIQRIAEEIGLLHGSADGKATPNLIGKYDGLVTTAIAATACPSKEEKLEEEANPVLKESRELLGAWLAEMVPVFAKATAAEQLLAAPKTADDFNANYAGSAEGAAFVTDEDATEMTIMGDLSFWMWLFWPDLEAVNNRVEAFAWIQEMEFVSCSPKTFEKLCARIGYSPDART